VSLCFGIFLLVGMAREHYAIAQFLFWAIAVVNAAVMVRINFGRWASAQRVPFGEGLTMGYTVVALFILLYHLLIARKF